ncbi:hypothetical protein C1I92_28820 [Jiangella anatolica]|uniref:Uncharacterized protein n=1 Tax=Jiangella anatolica TaxID=2670374 RepID=A0A2W2BHV8_9ACTN|nr:hypothetical protein C1I92_28820 [Jiangella anatolica]
MAAVVVLLTACGGGGGDAAGASSSPPPATEPVVTAPPALTPEEQAAAEIEATFVELIAAWDDFKANAGDYVDEAAGDPAWNFALVESEMRMLDAAQLDFFNSTNAFLDSEVEQVGETVVEAFAVREVAFGQDGVASARGEACLDLSGVSLATYDGAPAELPAEAGAYQRWAFTAVFLPSRGNWFVTNADVEVIEMCP